MKKYIEADKIMERINSASNGHKAVHGDIANLFADGLDYAVDLVDDMPAADVVPAQRWISVNEKLPDEETRVLVALDGTFNSYTLIDTDRILNGKWVRWSVSVTHWMPLPEPPKEE